MQNDRLARVLKILLPAKMAEDLADQGEDAAFIAEQLEVYLTADEESKADIAAFHEDGGVGEIEEEVAQGGRGSTPTADRPSEWNLN